MIFFNNVVHKPIIKISSELEAEYRSNRLRSDGDITVEFRIRKQGDTDWIYLNPYIISVTGVTQYKLVTDFNHFGPKILERNNEGLLEIATNDWTNDKDEYFTGSYDESLPYISSIKVLPLEGEPIKRDGKVIIKFEVTTDENKQFIIPVEFKIGKDTWDAKAILENMNSSWIFKVNGINSIDWKNLDDDFFNTIIEKEKPNLPDNIEVQYRINDAISNSGNLESSKLVVDFRYRRKDITNDLWTNFSSQYKLDIFLDKDLFDAQTALKDLSKDDISSTMDIEAVTSWQEITDDVYSNIMKVDPPSIPANMEVQYQIPNAITQDGDLVVNLRYKKTSSNNWYTITHTVKVLGLSLAKVKAYINSLQKKDYNTYKDNIDELLSTFGTNTLFTKEHANLIFNFPEGEEYQEPTNQNIKIYLLVENLTQYLKVVRLSFHFTHVTLQDNLVLDITE